METDRLIDSIAQRIDDGARAGFDRLLLLIDAGMAPRDAVASVLRSFNGRYVDDLRGAFADLLQRVVGRAELLALPVGDMPLSERLYAHARQVTTDVQTVVRQHAEGMQQARALALRLYDGYNPKDGIRRPLEGSARAALPWSLRAITQDVPTRKSMQRVFEQGMRSAAKLRTPALRAAYTQVFDAWSKGQGRDVLNRRLDVAMREKTRFMANRIAVTELARVNAAQQARELMADSTVDVVEVRINPMHPRDDICDFHARADLWGLGRGCYPKAKAPQPTYHPFCRCRLRSRPDKTAKGARETPDGAAAYLRSLPPGTSARVMGSGVNANRILMGESVDDVVNSGKDPAYHLLRLGDPEAQKHPLIKRAPEPDLARPRTLDELILAGRAVTTELPDGANDPAGCFAAILDRLKGINGKACAVRSSGEGAALVKQASKIYPASWNAAADAAGELVVRGQKGGRGWAWTASQDMSAACLPEFGIIRDVKAGQGYMVVRTGDLGNALHEYAHRLQAALPELDQVFQDLHRRRTAGDQLKRLRDLFPTHGYRSDELTREDSYLTPYQGKEYKVGGALEVMTMAFEQVLGQAGGDSASRGQAVQDFRRVWSQDREMVDLVVGLLLHWKP